MNILTKLTKESLLLNKKRTIGTIIGIILSVSLICAVSSMVTSFRQTLVENAISETGYYHIELSELKEKDLSKFERNKDIKEIHKMYNLGYANVVINNNDFPYLKVNSLSIDEYKNLSYNLLDGSLPRNEKEIVISEKFKIKSDYKIGDTITLDVGERKTSDGYTLNDNNPYSEENKEIIVNSKKRTYKIVGIVTKTNPDTDFYALTTNEKSAVMSAYISLKKPRDYKQSFVEMLGASSYKEIKEQKIEGLDFSYQLNNELLRWEAFSFSDSTLNMLFAVASVVVVIIIFTSVFCIRNSFAISTTEKMKMYGMLASIGATKKQIKKSVLTEGFILGLIAIPIGIVLGTFAVFILIKVVSLLLGNFLFPNIEGLVYKISLFPILISVFLGYITIYFSSLSSAKKAAKVSPIDNLRNTNEVKIESKKLHVPKFITKIFKIGGVIAYKNLKRSKKKYRTTVISLTISIFVFISMSAFLNEGFEKAGKYYTDFDYNGYMNLTPEIETEKIDKITNSDYVDESYLLYSADFNLKIQDFSKINPFEDDENLIYCEKVDNNECKNKYVMLHVLLYDDEDFKAYIEKIDGNYEKLKDKGIMVDTYQYYSKKKEKFIMDRRYTYKKGDKIHSEFMYNKGTVNFEIGEVTDIRPYGLENTYYSGGYIILNTKYFSNIEKSPYRLLLNSSNPEKLGEEINTIDEEFVFINLDLEAKGEKAMILVVSIFLYGFIAVITLIGITNIFNTITSNMELRQKEFAMLKSIGMTKKEFNHMINLETLFYSTKSLIYGIIFGIIGSLLVHKAFASDLETTFKLPINAIIISIVFVFILVYVIMRYSINKINKQNTIETIRKENI